jgi:exodeoxyribonuclease X
MPKIARVLDFETSGLPDNEAAEIIEYGFVDVDLTKPDFPLIVDSARQGLRKPVGPIPPETSAVHHFVDSDFADAPGHVEMTTALAGGLAEDDIYVAHNAAFEQHFYSNRPQAWLCTYKCALRAWPDAPGHGNQVLRYWLKLDVDPVLAMPPHRALPDAYVTAHILQQLLLLRPVERLLQISSEPGFLPMVRFGKHYGKPFKEAVAQDRRYFEWVANESTMDADVKFTAKWWLERQQENA